MKRYNAAASLLVLALGLLVFWGTPKIAGASGEDIEFELGTLPAGSTITLTFEVNVDAPFPAGQNQVSTQGRITDSASTVDVLTDDPSTPTLDQTTNQIGAQYSYSLTPGWSLVSLPVEVDDPSLQAIYPGAIALLAHDSGTYQLSPVLKAGSGYWLGLGNMAARTITGTPHPALILELPAGWSLIGSGHQKLDVGALQVASGGRLISVFGFDGAYYQESSMIPGAGYWVNMSAPGTLDLLSATAPKPGPTEKQPAEADLWASSGTWRQGIHLGVDSDQMIALPPLPNAEIFDVRVEVENVETWQVPFSYEPAEYSLKILGDQVELSWQRASELRGHWILQVNEREYPLVGTGAITVDGRTATVLLRQTGTGPIPRAHHLAQNYPNPFNPTTIIRYDVGEADQVALNLYDMAGQRVRKLVHIWQPAGSYNISWDGRNERGTQMANGIYLYELRVGAFRTVRKMVLMK